MKQKRIQKTKIFSIEEANRALALVRPIATDIFNLINKISNLKIENLEENSPEYQDLLKELQSDNFKLIHYLEELHTIGVIVTDLENVIIDFPGEHNGKEVFFCWKYNEPEVYYFHEAHCEEHCRKYIYSLSSKIN
jgi:hypothetical protein